MGDDDQVGRQSILEGAVEHGVTDESDMTGIFITDGAFEFCYNDNEQTP